MEYSNDSAIPERMRSWVRLYLWRCNHDKRMRAGVDRIIIATNVIGGVVDSSCPEAVDCIVANANIVSIVM
jgi:hypothetical protein